MRQKHFAQLFALCAVSCILLVFAFTKTTFAQDALGLAPASGVAGIGTDRTLPELIILVINILLGLLGTIAVAIVMYGGFLYMTAGGEVEKITKAKKLLINAAIGLVIILSAGAITNFTFGFLGDGRETITQSQPFDPFIDPGCTGAYCNVSYLASCPDPDPLSTAPYVCYLDSKTDYFNKLNADGTPANATKAPSEILHIYGGRFGASQGDGVVYFVKPFTTSTFDPATDIGTCKSTTCLQGEIINCGPVVQWQDTHIAVTLPAINTLGANGEKLFAVIQKGGDTKVYSITKNTSTLLTTAGHRNDAFVIGQASSLPQLACITPETAKAGDIVTLTGKNFVDSAKLTDAVIFKKGKEVLKDLFRPFTLTEIKVPVAVGSQSGGVKVRFNDALSKQEVFLKVTCDTDAQCGADGMCVAGLCVEKGDAQSPCTSNAQCKDGLTCTIDSGTTAGICTPANDPYITGFTPANGAPGTFVTIAGVNFGATKGNGKVEFYNTDRSLIATAPTQCGGADGSWDANQIIVATPPGLTTGQYFVRVTRGDGVSDTSDGLTGGLFTSDTTKRPGLCGVINADEVVTANKTKAYYGQSVTFSGASFKAADATQTTEVLFSGAPLALSGDIVEDSGTTVAIATAKVPNLRAQTVRGQVFVGTKTTNASGAVVTTGSYSNTVNFTVVNPPRVPKISYISRTSGPAGTYVSIVGENFLEKSATSSLYDSADANDKFDVYTKDSFPSYCSTESAWTDKVITIRIPDNATTDLNFSVRNADNQTSNTVAFDVCIPGAGCEVTAGICEITPTQGPAGTPITLKGEGFGAAGAKFLNTTALVGGSYTSATVTGDIPTNTQSGIVTVQPTDGAKSNEVFFEVSDCRDNTNSSTTPAGKKCCELNGQWTTEAEFATACKLNQPPVTKLSYEYTTGEGVPRAGVPFVAHEPQCDLSTASPSPYMNGLNTCVNAGISARFIDITGAPVPMNPATFTTANVQVYKCSGGATSNSFDATYCSVTDLSGTALAGTFSPINGTAVASVTPVIGFEFYPTANLSLNTWYFVTLKSGPNEITAQSGFWLDGDRDGIAEVDDDYSWAFKTGNDSVACTLNRVEVLPNLTTLDALEATQDYSAHAMAQNCNVLNATNYDWQWQTRLQTGSLGDAIAEIEGNTPNNTATATANGQGLVYVEGAPKTKVTADSPTARFLDKRDSNNKLIVDLNIPVILDVAPLDGFIHPLVNAYSIIQGYNFGNSQGVGKATFDGVESLLAQCPNAWSDNRILAQAPKQTLSFVTAQKNTTTTTSTFSSLDNEEVLVAYDFEDESVTVEKSRVGSTDALLVNAKKSKNENNTSLQLTNSTGTSSYAQVVLEGVDEVSQGSIAFTFTTPATLKNETLVTVQNPTTDTAKFNIVITDAGALFADGKLIANGLKASTSYSLVYSVHTDNTTSAYINGARVSTSNETPRFFDDIDAAGKVIVTIGGTSQVLTTPELSIESVGTFNGLIDSVVITKSPLTQAQVLTLADLHSNPSLIAWYNFNEEGVEVLDASGNGFNARSVATFPDRTLDGFFGRAVVFGQDVSVTNESLIANIPQGLLMNEMSLVAWVNPKDVSIASTIFSNGIYTLKTASCGADLCFVMNDGQSGERWVTADINNEWSLIVATKKVTAEGVRLALTVNGVTTTYPSDPATFITVPTYANSVDSVTCIGASRVGESCANQNFKGVVDEIILLSYALTDEQIASAYGVKNGAVIGVATDGGSDEFEYPFNRSQNIYPFICNLAPAQGPQGINLSISGDNFGDSHFDIQGASASQISFARYVESAITKIVNKITSWSNNVINIVNPIGNSYDERIEFTISTNPFDAPTPLTSNDGYFYTNPVVTSLSPDNGPVDSWVTVRGYNFGTTPGKVFFQGRSGVIQAALAAECGASAWTDKEIIVTVPAGAIKGAVYVEKTSTSNPVLTLTSNKDKQFTITDAPLGAGLCPIPGTHYVLAKAQVTGKRFGVTQGTSTITLSGQPLPATTNWSDTGALITIGGTQQTGDVVLTKQMVLGQECRGFSIGAFCPSGRVDVVGPVPSNAVTLNIVSDEICGLGVVGKQQNDFAPFNKATQQSVPVLVSAFDSSNYYGINKITGAITVIAALNNQATNQKYGEVLASYVPTPGSELTFATQLIAVDGVLYARKNAVDVADTSDVLGKVTLDENTDENTKLFTVDYTTGGGAQLIDRGSLIASNGTDLYSLTQTEVADITDGESGSVLFADGEYVYIWAASNKVYALTKSGNNVVSVYDTTISALGGFIDVRGNAIVHTATTLGMGPSYGISNSYSCSNVTGYACTTTADCELACVEGGSECVAGICSTVIHSITPNPIAQGGYVTIKGCFLGEDGTAYFTDVAGNQTLADVTMPSACGDTKTSKQWVVQVPKDDTGTPADEGAHTGPVLLERTNPSLFRTLTKSALTGTPAESTQINPKISFGVPDLAIDNSIVRPYVCKLEPNQGDPLSTMSVIGKDFGTYNSANSFVTFLSGLATDLKAEVGNWTDTRIDNVKVPLNATTGFVEVTNKDNQTSNNELTYTVNTISYGPAVIDTNPTPNAENNCTNSVIAVSFNKALEVTQTFAQNFSLHKCSNAPFPLPEPITAVSPKSSTIKSLFTSIRSLLRGNASFARHQDYHVADFSSCVSQPALPITVTTQLLGSGTQVLITPQNIMDPNSYYYVAISDAIQDDNGIGVLEKLSSGATQPVSVLPAELGGLMNVLFTDFKLDTGDDYGYAFKTRGNTNANDYDPGICQINDVKISVARTQDGVARSTQKDFYVCAGDNCLLEFDHDQAPLATGSTAITGNQHRYVAVGSSSSNTSESFIDQFQRTKLNQGDNSFVANAKFLLDNNSRLTVASDQAVGMITAKIAKSNTTDVVRKFNAFTPFTASARITGVGAGLYVGGVTVTLQKLGDEYVYQLVTNNNTVYNSLPTLSPAQNALWEITHANGTYEVRINDQVVLPRANTSITGYSNGEFGLVYNGTTGATVAYYDDYSLTVSSDNMLRARYYWSRTDTIDPARIVGIHDGSTPTLTNRYQTLNGQAFISVQPVASGQTKISAEATLEGIPAIYANTVSKELPINVFICENPWPNYNSQFTDSINNFMTRYCRDVEGNKDPLKTLPAAGIVEKK